MQLLKQKDGIWQIGAGETINWSTPEQFQDNAALLLNVDDEPKTDWASACIIAVNFPSITDGRGLSLAVLLRQRIGFKGDLRAVGAVHEDIVHFMLRCGFTSFELANDRNPENALNQLAPYSNHYQNSVIAPLPSIVRLATQA